MTDVTNRSGPVFGVELAMSNHDQRLIICLADLRKQSLIGRFAQYMLRITRFCGLVLFALVFLAQIC